MRPSLSAQWLGQWMGKIGVLMPSVMTFANEWPVSEIWWWLERFENGRVLIRHDREGKLKTYDPLSSLNKRTSNRGLE